MKRVLLVGQPNSGKSALFNALAGPRAVASNYPGTTVELQRAALRLHGERIELIDTPGIYSLSDATLEEQVAKRAVLKSEPALVIDIVDASSLEKGLYLTLQLLEASPALVIALNFYEEAQKRGIIVDPERLTTILGVPVIVVNPLAGVGLAKLRELIGHPKRALARGFVVNYDDHVEGAIRGVAEHVHPDSPFPPRFIAIRSLEGDPELQRYLNSPQVLDGLVVPHHLNLRADIAINRHGVAAYIARLVTRLERPKKERRWEKRLDTVLLHPRLGLPLALLTFLGIFFVLLYLGGIIQNYLSEFVNAVVVPGIAGMTAALPLYLGEILQDAITGTSAGIAIAIPYIFLFYLILALLEDFGILPRFILSLDRLMRRFGLPGQALIPLLLGLGCSVPAITATRLLNTRAERIKAAALFSIIPCSSRTAIILGIVGHYAGAGAALGIYALASVFIIGTGFLMKRVIKTPPPPLLLELPPYRRPRLENVLIKSWLRMKGFVVVVIPMLILGGAAYGLLKGFNLELVIVQPLHAFTVGWLHLPAKAITALLYGFLQKDLTPAMLVSVAGTMDLQSFMTPLQIFTFGMASTFQVPCIIALGMLMRELGLRVALAIWLGSLIFWMAVVGIVLRILLPLGGP